MRFLYIDIDSLRSDRLGCNGYPRRTTPNIDRIASRGVTIANCHASDVPCMPSRTSLFSGRFGYRHGVVNHSGTRASPYPEHRLGAPSMRSPFATTSLPAQLRDAAGYVTATVSSFAERHSAHHFLSGFGHVHDTGGLGHEIAEDVTPAALDWLDRHGEGPDWFLHVQYWDVHIPYRTPDEEDGFAPETRPSPWLDDDTIRRHRTEPGIRSARDMLSVSTLPEGAYPHQVREVTDLDDVAGIIDEYDRALRHVDRHIGLLMDKLDALGIGDDVTILVSADHGECLGELNSYCGHNLADAATTHVPLVIAAPERIAPGTRCDALVYQMDLAATVLDLAGVPVPEAWDAESTLPAIAGGPGRDVLVMSQLAQACQRAVLFRESGRRLYLIRTYEGGFHEFPEVMLFDLDADPHEQNDLAPDRAALVEIGLGHLGSWEKRMAATAPVAGDPLLTVLEEGPQGSAGRLEPYLRRLAETGREEAAERIRARYGA